MEHRTHRLRRIRAAPQASDVFSVTANAQQEVCHDLRAWELEYLTIDDGDGLGLDLFAAA